MTDLEDVPEPDGYDDVIEWRVVWFPDDKPFMTYTNTDETKVRRRAEKVAEFNPMVESRKIGAWT